MQELETGHTKSSKNDMLAGRIAKALFKLTFYDGFPVKTVYVDDRHYVHTDAIGTSIK